MIKKLSNKKAFTLIELIVVMAVVGILVLLAMPKFIGYTKKAHLTEIKSNIKQLENASERYYIDTQDWPRLSDTPYSAEQVEVFAQEIKNKTGAIVTLDPDGKYYEINYDQLHKYVQKPKDGMHYILQNPIGEVFYLENVTDIGKNALKQDSNSTNVKPTAVITMNPNNITVGTNITWSYMNSTDPDGDKIINAEWVGKQDVYTKAGNYTVKLRVQDAKGLWSDWVEKTIEVNGPIEFQSTLRLNLWSTITVNSLSPTNPVDVKVEFSNNQDMSNAIVQEYQNVNGAITLPSGANSKKYVKITAYTNEQSKLDSILIRETKSPSTPLNSYYNTYVIANTHGAFKSAFDGVKNNANSGVSFAEGADNYNSTVYFVDEALSQVKNSKLINVYANPAYEVNGNITWLYGNFSMTFFDKSGNIIPLSNISSDASATISFSKDNANSVLSQSAKINNTTSEIYGFNVVTSGLHPIFNELEFLESITDTNISLTSGSAIPGITSSRITWPTNIPNISSVAIFLNNTFAGSATYSTGAYMVANNPGTTYEVKIIPIASNAQRGNPYIFNMTTLPTTINFTSGIGIKAIDGDVSTYEDFVTNGSRNFTWGESLAGKTLTFTITIGSHTNMGNSYAGVTLYNEAGVAVATGSFMGTYSTVTKTITIVVPADAVRGTVQINGNGISWLKEITKS